MIIIDYDGSHQNWSGSVDTSKAPIILNRTDFRTRANLLEKEPSWVQELIRPLIPVSDESVNWNKTTPEHCLIVGWKKVQKSRSNKRREAAGLSWGGVFSQKQWGVLKWWRVWDEGRRVKTSNWRTDVHWGEHWLTSSLSLYRSISLALSRSADFISAPRFSPFNLHPERLQSVTTRPKVSGHLKMCLHKCSGVEG